MMFKIILLLSLIFFPATLTYSQYHDTAINNEIEVFIEEYSQEFPGLAVAVIKEGELIINKTYGYEDLVTKSSVTSSTKFNIYSTSKFILGMAYLKLVLDDKVDLEQKIVEIDPTLPEAYNEITVGHLLSHTSGIRHYNGRKDWVRFSKLEVNSPKESMQHFIDDPLLFEPGEREEYSTYGMVVASHILEIITGYSFENALNNILDLGFNYKLDDTDVNKATPYIKRFWRYTEIPDLNAKSKYGGGGLIASAEELARSGEFLFQDIELIQRIKSEFKKEWDKDRKIAFGTFAGISNETFGQPDVLYATIGGGSPGGRSYLFVVADLELSIAITGNFESDGDEAYEFCKKLAMMVLEL